MTRRIRQNLSPGVVLGLIAIMVAVSGSSIAIAQQAKKKDTLRTRLGGATQMVVQNVALLPLTNNNGVSDHTVSCPSNPKLGPGVAIGGGVIDPRPPASTRNMAPLAQKTDGPSPQGTSAWLFQFHNTTNEALPVQLSVLCTYSKLNTKRG